MQFPWYTAIPFILLLLCIAVLPLFAAHFWEQNRSKVLVTAFITLPFISYLFAAQGPAASWHLLEHAALDYLSFIALLGALFTICGGIHIGGSLSGTPLANTILLLIGAVIANFIGTTGASIVLIRPLLRANHTRRQRQHIIIFFIFVVSNCGGLLTPLGDPPLFLGFLKGVPFFWTLRLWKEWLLVNGLLLVVFNIMDQIIFAREEKDLPGSQLEEVQKHQPLHVQGLHNLVFLLAVILVIIAKGSGWGMAGQPWPFGLQEGLMLVLAVGSYFGTRKDLHHRNQFSFGPIQEVAILFAGIFFTMIAPLEMMNAAGPTLGIREPWQFYWASGVLSSFLDNAPTYLTFTALASGLHGINIDSALYMQDLLATGSPALRLVEAISCGAVMMGANTYIGNGPNFMVKAIAEHAGVKMPSFFGYMAYSGAILIPIFILVTFLIFI